ncbi:MAG: hypothetical protein ACI9MB_004351, partial [Verrucomicrobiales bacterium]
MIDQFTGRRKPNGFRTVPTKANTKSKNIHELTEDHRLPKTLLRLEPG